MPGKGDRIAVLRGRRGYRARRSAGIFGETRKFLRRASRASSGRCKNDSSIKGVIVRVDSPGGDAVASDEILHELKMLSAAKPLAISMSDYAASGGYFMSMTGDPIVSYPDTLTGSIGVLYIGRICMACSTNWA